MCKWQRKSVDENMMQGDRGGDGLLYKIHSKEKKVSWASLFFDLVFVVLIAQLAELLHQGIIGEAHGPIVCNPAENSNSSNHSLHPAGHHASNHHLRVLTSAPSHGATNGSDSEVSLFNLSTSNSKILLFFVYGLLVWRVWRNEVYMNSRVEGGDDIIGRMIYMVKVFTAGGIATTINVELSAYSLFAFSFDYGMHSIAHALKIARVYYHVKRARAELKWTLSRLFLQIIICFTAANYPDVNGKVILLMILFSMHIFVFVLGSLLGATVDDFTNMPLNPAHYTERYGLITIIALGEAITHLLTVNSSTLRADTMTSRLGGSILSTIILYGLFWIYFNISSENVVAYRFLLILWSHFHSILIMGITALAVGFGTGLEWFVECGGLVPMKKSAQWLICIAFSVVMFSLNMIQLIAWRRMERDSPEMHLWDSFQHRYVRRPAVYLLFVILTCLPLMTDWAPVGLLGFFAILVVLRIVVDFQMGFNVERKMKEYKKAKLSGEQQTSNHAKPTEITLKIEESKKVCCD